MNIDDDVTATDCQHCIFSTQLKLVHSEPLCGPKYKAYMYRYKYGNLISFLQLYCMPQLKVALARGCIPLFWHHILESTGFFGCKFLMIFFQALITQEPNETKKGAALTECLISAFFILF